MKKYMFFQPVLLLYLCTSSYVKSMEIDFVENVLCYFNALPVDILDYIGQFLPWESEEECIIRTNKEKDEEFPKQHYIYFSSDDLLGKEHICGVFSPDKNKIALCSLFPGACHNPKCLICKTSQLLIVDLQEKEEDKIIHFEQFDKRCYRTIAVSSSGSLFAVIIKQMKNEEICTPSYPDQDILILKDRNKNKNRTFEITDGFMVKRLMFNKQGTTVIAHGNDYSCQPVKEKHVFFNLKNNVDKEIVIKNKDEKNRLLDYFRHNCVCKNILGNNKNS